jgi:hypothetical protein
MTFFSKASVMAAALFALLLLNAWPASAQSGASPGQPVVVSGAVYRDFTSTINGRAYRLFISIPEGPAPADGRPTVYVLDGNSSFLTARDAVRSQSAFSEIRPAVVVGIGYPLSDSMEILKTRNKDLTLPISQDVLLRMPPNPGLTLDNTGGLDDFLKVIEEEIKPLVSSMTPVNLNDQTLMGHSLGGLAVVRALFTTPSSYRTFVASSPSLFWNEKAVLEDEAAFIRNVETGMIAPRVLIAVGALEGDPLLFRTGGYPMTQEEVDATIRDVAMLANARALGERLQRVQGDKDYRAVSVIFAGESHLSVIPAVISRGINFALNVDGDEPPARKSPTR